ncbi:MAG: type II toxin-antitoxin system death-on-curing family toxin [Pelomonas sp.]|nr:type II toxin-antitoxin system death-on-curing family toxin [Roseateles sp.]
MTAWVWLEAAVLVAVHEEQLTEHGGPAGTRDVGLLESALARPQQRASYGDPDAAELAACYAFGIARNHPFVDGNKRTAFVASELFLMLNGHLLTASDAECVLATLELASGQWDEAAFAAWLREHSRRS